MQDKMTRERQLVQLLRQTSQKIKIQSKFPFISVIVGENIVESIRFELGFINSTPIKLNLKTHYIVVILITRPVVYARLASKARTQEKMYNLDSLVEHMFSLGVKTMTPKSPHQS